MRWPRVPIQRLMVVLVVVAILLWAGREVAPDLIRRWDACRRRAAWHSTQVTLMPPRMARSGWGKHQVAYHKRMRQLYRRALFIPWQFYSLGGSLPPFDNP